MARLVDDVSVNTVMAFITQCLVQVTNRVGRRVTPFMPEQYLDNTLTSIQQ